jgi:MFS family permease
MASMSGDMIYEIGLLWVTLELTGSETTTGLVAMASYLPAVIFSLAAGIAADRWNRRTVMLVADLVRFLVVITVPVIAWFGWLSPTALGVNAFLIAIAATFFNPARDSIVPELVPASGLLRANSLIQTSWQFSLLLGPVIAGAVLHYFGKIPIFTAAAVTYLFSFGTILAMRITARTFPEGGNQIKWRDVMEGLSYVAHHRVIGPLLLITIADNLFIMGPAIVGTPIIVKQVLGLGGEAYSAVLGCYAIGMLLGTAGLLSFGSSWGKGKVLLIGMFLDGITFVPIYWVDSILAFEAIIIIHSLAIPMLMVTRASLIQSIVEPAMTGRVFALVNLAVLGMSALSAGASGMIIGMFGAREVFAVIGIGGGLCGVIGWIWAKNLKAAT